MCYRLKSSAHSVQCIKNVLANCVCIDLMILRRFSAANHGFSGTSLTHSSHLNPFIHSSQRNEGTGTEGVFPVVFLVVVACAAIPVVLGTEERPPR